jgi:hypothetical protein
VQAGTRLIQQEQSRLHRQRSRKAHELLLAERQHVGARVAQGLELQELQDRLDSRALHWLFASEPVKPGWPAKVKMPTNQDVVGDAQAREELDVLEATTDSQARNFVSGHSHEVVLAVADRALTRAMRATHTIQERRLARPVRANQCNDLAGVNVEVDIVQDRQAPEAQ